jgi:hypothetical protein
LKTPCDPAAFSQTEETTMYPSYHRRRPDRRFGIVLIAVFALGILGASLATIMNGGELPQSAAATVHLTKISAPL